MHSMKVNFDRAFHDNTGAGGWGYVVHDQAGEFYRCWCRQVCEPEFVAHLAAVDGVTRIGANQIIFESDSSILVHALKSNG